MRDTSSTLRAGRIATLCFAAGVAALWIMLSMIYPPYLVPRPQAVLDNIVLFVADWSHARHTVATLGHIVVSMAAALVLGGLLATLAHFVPVLKVAIHHRLSPFANSFSSIGWTILAVVWLGIGLPTVLIAMTAILLPFVLVNLRAGYESLPEEQIEMAHSFSRSRVRQVRLVMLPLLVPYLFATLRITFGMACQVVLITELFGGNSGLGYLVNLASQEVNTPLIFAVALMMVVLFQLIDRLLFDPLQQRISKTYAYT